MMFQAEVASYIKVLLVKVLLYNLKRDILIPPKF